MSRNQNRLGENNKPQNTSPAGAFNPLDFVAPTEFVELPSEGQGYPDSHPLHNQSTVEIRYMTAKDEDILTSQTLLKKGVAIERFLQNILVNKDIDSKSLLIGDRNAILVAARISGFGSEYHATVNCTSCGTPNKVCFDLSNSVLKNKVLSEDLEYQFTSNGTYQVKLPFSGFTIEVKLMDGEDENYIAKYLTSLRDNDLPENLLTTQYKRIIKSIEGYTDREVINKFIDNMPTPDSRHLRLVNKLATPDIEIKEPVTCKKCSHKEEVEVPFGTDFFWPDR